MIIIDRLFHLDLACLWNRDALVYEPHPPAKFDKLFSDRMAAFAKSRAAVISANCLFPGDENYVKEVLAAHADAVLKIDLVFHLDGPPTLASERRVETRVLDEAAVQAVRDALAAPRLPNGFPQLAEIQIHLSA